METGYQKIIDCQGLSCPLPILKTKQAIDDINSGEILKIISTDPGSINDIASWSNTTGHNLISSTEINGKFIYLVQKK
tara:strand:- start:855 stop:1088 length:234 start_codon:yes stop_codon:yes gene_type:complete